MPSLSLNIGLNNGRKLPFGGGAAPSGIPVASTSAVIVSGSPGGFNGTYDKQTATIFQQFVDPDKTLLWDSGDAVIPNRWSLYNSDTNAIVTHQTWSDQTQIPASGWPNGETITAA
jgi:hypothetical protein